MLQEHVVTAEPKAGGRGPERTILAYFGLLIVATGVMFQLPSLPVRLHLKDNNGASVETLAKFWWIITIPQYFGFVAGILRDRWSPFRLGDRGYLFLFGVGALAWAVWLTSDPYPYSRMLAGGLLGLTILQFLNAAIQGQMAGASERFSMSGRLSAVVNMTSALLGILVPILGGLLVGNLPLVFLMGAIGAMAVIAAGIWSPAGLTPRGRVQEIEEPTGSRTNGPPRDLSAVLRTSWPAIGVWILWGFAPVMGDPLLYHQTDSLNLSSEQIGLFGAIQAAACLPVSMLHVLLARRLPLTRILRLAAICAIIQPIPLMLMGTPMGAMAAAAAVGLLGAIPATAFFDLLLRSCPRRFEGTMMAIAGTGLALSSQSGNMFGSWVYSRSGFPTTVFATIGILILLPYVLRAVPLEVTLRREGFHHSA